MGQRRRALAARHSALDGIVAASPAKPFGANKAVPCPGHALVSTCSKLPHILPAGAWTCQHSAWAWDLGFRIDSVGAWRALHPHNSVDSRAHREVVELALGLPRHLLHPCSERRVVAKDQQPLPRLLVLVHHVLHVQLQGGNIMSLMITYRAAAGPKSNLLIDEVKWWVLSAAVTRAAAADAEYSRLQQCDDTGTNRGAQSDVKQLTTALCCNMADTGPPRQHVTSTVNKARATARRCWPALVSGAPGAGCCGCAAPPPRACR